MKTKRILSLLMTLALCLSLIPSAALAGAGPQTVPEWAVDEGRDVQEGTVSLQGNLPAKYDLRSEGLVTPVKLQNPWGSCWAFGGIAAAETSILSAYGSTYEKSGLDLSERHLAYFAMQPVTEDIAPGQAGEGLHTYDTSPNAPFDAGGKGIYVTTLFSQGIGPIMEEDFPYRGEDGTTSLEYFEEHSDEETWEQIGLAAEGQGITAEEFLQIRAAANGCSEEDMFAYFRQVVEDAYKSSMSYSKNDDWSIPETNADGSSNRLLNAGVVLKDGNVLPSYWTGAGYEAPNADSMRAIKQELVNGRGVSILYYADQSGKYTMTTEEGGNQFCQYIDDESLSIDHSVCIVGWDDDYAVTNFDPDRQPPDKGAWIVKNSWGSTKDAVTDADGNVWNNGQYGILDADGKYTGYFYLSYYDRTISQPETMDFSSDLGTDGFYTLQYDYMPANIGFYTTPASETAVSAANVFQIDRPMELKSVSARTAEANMRVTFAIYVTKDGTTPPAKDDKPVCRTSRNFEYAGFHRLDLDQSITVEAGDAVWVVTTASVLNGDGKRVYTASANQGLSKESSDQYRQQGYTVKTYAVAVVNEGESFLYSGDAWTDWADYLADVREAGQNIEEVDNFSIKLYAEPGEKEPLPPISYLTWDAGSNAMKEAENVCDDYTLVTADDTVWGAAGAETWYAVSDTLTNNNRIQVRGTVNLILGAGATLTAAKGITVTDGSTLNIYTTAMGAGTLYAGTDGTNVTCLGDCAGIGGAYNSSANEQTACGAITINSGTVIAAGGENGAGIGGCAYGDGGDVTISSNVTAAGGEGGAGIGGGYLGNGGNVTVRAGSVTASGGRGDGSSGAGIGLGAPNISVPNRNQGSLTVGNTLYVYGDDAGGSTYRGAGTGGAYSGDRYQFMVINSSRPAGGNNNSYTGGGGGGGAAAPADNPVTVPASTSGASSHGTVKASAANARAGDKVVLTPEPEEGYEMTGLTVTDARGNEVPVTQNPDGTYSFTMPDTAVSITPVFEEITDQPDGDVSARFRDVKQDAWYHDPVQWAVDKGLMNGVGEDTFSPNGTATRAMVVTMLWRLAGEPETGTSDFGDVDAGSWYAQAVAWAAETGAVNGTSEATFSPNEPVTREQLAAILYRYAQNQGKGFTGSWMFLLDFPDADQVSDWAGEAMHWMVMQGVITGMDDGTLAPKADATRAQIAAMFQRFAAEMEK